MGSVLKNKKGFTLIEVLISLAILGIIVFAFLNLFGTSFVNIYTMGGKDRAMAQASDIMEILYNQQEKSYKDLEFKETANDRDSIQKARDWMCKNFYDIRTFGAVMNTSKFNCGQVQGPMQLTFARSVDPIIPMDLSITRVAVTKPEDARKVTKDSEGESSDKVTEMGRKSIVPYGLYIGYGFFNPYQADDTGMRDNDLKIFWEALMKMWDVDRSASKGLMACRGIYIFTHKDKTGNAPAHKLIEMVEVKKKKDVKIPRDFKGYKVKINPDFNEKFDDITLSVLLD